MSEQSTSNERCKAEVMMDTGFYRTTGCSRRAVKDGYCKQHHPDAIRQRAAEADRRWKEKQASSPIALLSAARKEVEQLRARVAELERPPVDDLRADAERWRALIGCARITAMGSAGLDQRRADGYAHVTLNFWTHGEHEKDSYSREWLRTFADIARASLTKDATP